MSLGPKIIFLQGMTNPILPFDEITWCKDKINEDDIKYIKFEEYAKLKKKIKKLEQAHEKSTRI